MPELKRLAPKTFALKSATMTGNTMTGNPAIYGNLDRGADVVYPKAIKAAVYARFLRDGFIADSHQWEKMIGYPTVAEDRDGQPYSEMEYHSTQDAQDIKTKCQERLDAGKSVGLSIGFGLYDEDVAHFRSGAELLAHAKGLGHDLKDFDTATLKQHKGACRGIVNISELYEWSPVAVPMNQDAAALAIKAFDDDETEEDRLAEAMPEAENMPTEQETKDLTFTEKLAALETAVAEFITLSSRRQEVRVKEGRTHSRSTREKLNAIKDSLSGHCDTLGDMADDPKLDEKPDTDDTKASSQALDLAILDMEADAIIAGLGELTSA